MKWFVFDLHVSVEGTPERLRSFLSSVTAAQSSIELSQLKFSQQNLSFHVAAEHLPVLRKVRRRAGVKIKVHKPIGRLCIQVPVVIAFLLLIALPFCSQFFYLDYAVEADSEQQLIVDTYFEKHHLKFPMRRTRLPATESIRNDLMKQHNSIAWVMISRQHSVVKVTVVPSPKPVTPENWPEAKQFIAAYDGQIDRVQLIEGTSLVRRKDIVKKGDVLAVGTGGKLAKGEITGIYFREVEFQFDSPSKTFDYSSSHADAIIRQFIEEQQQETKIKGIKVLQVQNVNGKVRGKVLVKIQGILAKPEYLKETLND